MPQSNSLGSFASNLGMGGVVPTLPIIGDIGPQTMLRNIQDEFTLSVNPPIDINGYQTLSFTLDQIPFDLTAVYLYVNGEKEDVGEWNGTTVDNGVWAISSNSGTFITIKFNTAPVPLGGAGYALDANPPQPDILMFEYEYDWAI